VSTQPTKPEPSEETRAGLGESDKLIKLATVQNGYAEALFQRELLKALQNIHDPNTDLKTGRVINMRFTLVPKSEDRHQVDLVISAGTKLAAVEKKQSTIFTGLHKNKYIAIESDPKQRGLFDNTPDIAPATPIVAAGAQKGAQV
jgi:hypothetical protein